MLIYIYRKLMKTVLTFPIGGDDFNEKQKNNVNCTFTFYNY